jgi:membrane associated rhomboid family serine protease
MKRRAPALPVATLGPAAVIQGVYGLELAGDGQAVCDAYGLVPARPSLVTALTSMWLHDPSTFWHAGGNLATLVLVGSRVERAIGSTRFAAIYFVGGLAGAALHLVVDPTSTVPLVGASGALFAVLAVAAVVFGPGMLAFTVVLALTNIVHAFGAAGPPGVSFGTHLGGFAFGVLVVALARLRGVDLRLRAITPRPQGPEEEENTERPVELVAAS